MSWSSKDQEQLDSLLAKAKHHGVHLDLSDDGLELLAGMTDASKRREEFQDDDQSAKRQMPIHRKNPPDTMNCKGSASDYVGGSEDVAVPYPKSRPAKLLPMFPPGISSLEEWSTSVIDFGKFMGKNVSYGELLNRTDSEAVDYVKWCKSRFSCSKGFLHDLSGFLIRAELEDPKYVNYIPGTEVARRFKQ